MLHISNANNAFFRQMLFILLLITLGIVIFDQLKFFIGTFLGATTLYVVLRGWQGRLVFKAGLRSWLAALILVSACTLLFIVFGFFVVEMISSEVVSVDTGDVMSKLDSLLAEVNDLTGYEIVPAKILSDSRETLTSLVSSILNTTYSFAVNIFMMLLVLYFMLANCEKMERVIFCYVPFRGRSLELLKHEAKGMIFGNAVGIPLVMFIQGIAAIFIYWMLGMSNVFFWAFLTSIFGLVPVVGTAFVWVALSVYFIATGNLLYGIILLAYGFLVISNVDNLARIFLMKRAANTHPLIVIFGVLLGIPLFGFWGIIFGPLLISSFILLIKIYYVEYGVFNEDPYIADNNKDNNKKETEV
ncbi:MAG: AI-2E family transporter [Culturomica sp.]|jgi:predicted PurR-regulated permease PerM|nr:AI-2E family transporter [Culturomica sp.]